jgi:hypothetical protein
MENVVLNVFQHLKESNTYETLKRVQGDKTVIATQSPRKGSFEFLNVLDHG